MRPQPDPPERTPPAPTYSVGDYVWTQHAQGQQIGCIADARPKVNFGSDWWSVRVVDQQDRSWTSPHQRRVLYALSPVEVHSYRIVGLIPARGKEPWLQPAR